MRIAVGDERVKFTVIVAIEKIAAPADILSRDGAQARGHHLVLEYSAGQGSVERTIA